MQFEILCELTDGKGITNWVTYDWAHTEDEARKKVTALRAKKRNTKYHDLERDKKKKDKADDRRRRRYEDEE